VDQSPAVSKRMGLPTIPLACLTLRTMSQTIEIFKQNQLSKASLATPLPTNTSLPSSPSPTSPLHPLDATLRRIVSLGNGVGWEVWFVTNGLYLVGFILGFIALLLLKLFIGIYLLKFARSRIAGMARREEGERQWDEGPRKGLNAGKGTRGGVEVEERVRKMLDRGEDDLLGLGRGDEGKGLLKVERYSMVSKRIW
jgi:Eukaryotic membrane protein family